VFRKKNHAKGSKTRNKAKRRKNIFLNLILNSVKTAIKRNLEHHKFSLRAVKMLVDDKMLVKNII